jgi:hypothetical protein
MENPEFNIEPTAEECAEVVRRLNGIQQEVTEVSQRLGLKQEVLAIIQIINNYK